MTAHRNRFKRLKPGYFYAVDIDEIYIRYYDGTVHVFGTRNRETGEPQSESIESNPSTLNSWYDQEMSARRSWGEHEKLDLEDVYLGPLSLWK